MAIALPAIPLIVKFAEVAGIVVSGVATAAGLDKLSNKVEEYIEENPEQSQKIFNMIMPAQGLANILKNESDDGEESSEEEVVEVEKKPKLTGKEKGMRIREAIRRARAGKGNYSSPDAEGPAVDIRGSVIREVEDMGMADKNLKDNYKKSNFDYKKYFRKADGGMMEYANGGGIGSMMERKSFRGGGSYQGGSGAPGSAESSSKSSTNQGPAGGASSGGNYGGNTNPNQTYGGGGNNNTPPPKVKKNIITKSAKDLAALFNVPVQGIQSLFGNPFNKKGGFLTKAALTKGQIENLEEDANAIGGLSGNITNTTYGSPNNTFGFNKNMDLTDFANSATFGQGNFITDPTTGKKSFDGGNYDFKQDQFGKVGNFINAGGLTGTVDRFGASLYEDPGKITEMNYLANGGRVNYNQGSNWWDTLDSNGMNVYNSMRRGGHDDATIQNQLSMLGYYDANAAPPDSTPDTPQVVQQLGYQGGDDNQNIRTSKNYIRPDGSYKGLGTLGLTGSISQSGPGRQEDPMGGAFMEEDEEGILGMGKKQLGNLMSFAGGLAIPGAGMAMRGINALGSRMPVNSRAINENQALANGIYLDDIGRVVQGQGSYMDPSGNNILTGYNYNQIKADHFSKRREKARKKMSSEGFLKFDTAITAAEKNWNQTQKEKNDIVAAKERNKYMQQAQNNSDQRDPNQGNTVTGHGKSGMGRDPNDRMAYGGSVGVGSMFRRKR